MYQFSNHPLYQKHTIDSAMNSLWDFYKKNFVVLFITSLVMSLGIQYIAANVNLAELQSLTDPKELLESMREFIRPMLLISLINLLFTAIIHYYILYHSIDNQISIYASAINSLRYFLPYLIIIVLLAFAGTIAIVLGLLVFVIGAVFSGLYILTLYLMILPILMVEGPDIGNAIRRTIKLTHHGFWTNIGWVAVFIILLIVASVILSSVILLPFSGSFIRTLMDPGNVEMTELAKNPAFMIMSAVVNALTFPLMPIFACILYFNGKAGEEQLYIVPEKKEDDKIKVEDLYARPYSEDHPENPEKQN